ncbi:vWA domain-containing protein [Corynebacterium bovis]|uniref:vWA domain-containing protein n=1 Tax=Corynebacterium bovis TaxID=36808 RepID=UPI00313905A4
MPANAEVPRTPDTTILAADAAAAPTDAGAAPGGVGYADAPGQSAAPGTARIRITARAFTDSPWTQSTRDVAAQSTDARYSQGITFELWSAVEDPRDVWLPTDDYKNKEVIDRIENSGPQSRIDADWARCTTGADGRCDIVVPREGLNKRYFVRQISDAPGAFHTDDLTWARPKSPRLRVGLPGLTGKLQSGRVYTSPSSRMPLGQDPSEKRDPRGSFGAAAQSIVTPPLDIAQVCAEPGPAPTIALVLDTTGSIKNSGNVETLREAVLGKNGFLENLKGTGVKIASFSFATVSPGVRRENSAEPLNIDTDYDTIANRIRERQLHNIEGLTNWEDGLRAVDEFNAKYKYDEVIFVTDGDPNRWSHNPNVNVGTDGSVRGVEAAIYWANRIKEAHTRIVTIGAGFAETDTSWDGEGNLKAISGAVNGADYFATKWTDLAQTLRSAAAQFQCPTPISVKKTIVDGTGAELPDQSAANDWAVDVRVDNLAGFVDNGRGKNPSKIPLASLAPNADTADDSDVDTSAAVLRDGARTGGDTHTARWALTFNAGQKENAHGDVTLSEKTDSKPGYRFVPGRTVDGKTVGSHYRIFDRSTGQTVGRDVLITSPTQTIPNVTRGQGVEAVFANTPEPKISVAKTAKTNEVTVGTDGTFTAEYTVTVTNTADSAAVAEPVGDRPQLPEGWTVRSVSVDGEERTAGGDGIYPVARDLVLAGHATKEYTVAVTGAPPKEFTDGRTPEQCSAENPQGGVRNTVTMGGDTDGDGNNAACVTVIPPAPGRPTVTKTLDSVNRKDDGTATATYTVTVTGDAQRPSWYTLADRPSFAPNVTIDGWTVTAGAGTPEVTPAINGPYADPGTIVGTEAKIDPGATHTYTVEFRLRGLKDVPTANVVCTPGEDAPGHGLFNEATLNAGRHEQTVDACGPVPATPGALKIVKKIKGNDANDAPGVEVAPGEDMPVTYEVTNTGELPVFDVTVTDKITTEGDKVVDGITVSDEERPKAEKLNGGQTVTFTATVKAPATGGTLHTDLAQAHGVPPKPGKPNEPGDPNDPQSPPVNSNEDPANATTSFKDGLTIVKKINGDDANDAPGVTVEPGADMDVTYEVTNTGNRPVYNVTVADKITTEGDKAVEGITASDEAKAAKLDPGQTVTFSAKVKAPAANGTLHTDKATAHAVPPKPGKPNEPGDPNDPQSPPVNSNEDPANATTKTPAETSSSTPPAPPAVTSTTEPPVSSTEPAPSTSSTEPRPTTTEPPASSTEPAPSTSTTEPSPSAPATSSTEPSATTSVPPAPTTPVTPPPTGSIPFLPLIPLLIPPIPLPVPPAPVMPPAPPVPGTVTPQAPVPPVTRTPGAPEPGVPTPPTTVTPGVAGDRAPGAAQPSEAGRQGVLAKTGVSAGLGYALLAGLVLLVAGGVFVIAGLRRRQEGDRS